MMKKLLVLTAIATLTVGTVGCGWCDWFHRGALFSTTTTVGPEVPCDPCYSVNPCDPCDPCGAAVPCDPCAPGGCTTAPSIYGTPPATYDTQPGTQPSTVLPGPGPDSNTPSQ